MRRRLALAGVVLLGAALRLFPIWFGLPYPHARPDEATVLGHAAGILRGDANPHFFNWPSLTFYVMAGVFAAVARVKPALGYADYTLIARGVIALAGTATILVLARLARRIADDSTAIVAALLLAVAILHVRESHFALTDVLMTLLVVASLALAVEAIETERLTVWAIAGLIGGLAASAKYSAAALVAVALVVPGGWRSRLLFLSAFAAGFLAGTPYALLDFGAFQTDVRFERAHLAAGHAAADLGRGWVYHLVRSLPYGLGIPTFVAALGGLVALAMNRWTSGIQRRALWPLALFAIVFFAAIGSGRTVFFRYILPLLPLACLSAAVAIRTLAVSLASRTRMSRDLATTVLALLVASMPFVNTLRMDLRLARSDTRVLAAQWLAPQLRPDDTLYDDGTDYTRLDLGGARFHDWRYDRLTRSFANANGNVPEWIVLYDSPLTSQAPLDASLRALTGARYMRVYAVDGARDTAALYDPQDAFFLPLAGFSGVERPGPNVSIYRRSR